MSPRPGWRLWIDANLGLETLFGRPGPGLQNEAKKGKWRSKLQASDGTRLGTFGVGGDPHYVAFDGDNIWVTNANSNTVTKLRASDGLILGTFAAGSFPVRIAFDGPTCG